MGPVEQAILQGSHQCSHLHEGRPFEEKREVKEGEISGTKRVESYQYSEYKPIFTGERREVETGGRVGENMEILSSKYVTGFVEQGQKPIQTSQ
jgi:hypothetical protein